MHFLRVHGSENTFFLIDQRQEQLTTAQLQQLAPILCSQQKGLLGGADGILAVGNSEKALGKMTVINADGSLAKMCGNGLRTVSRYLAEQGGQTRFTVETGAGVLRVQKDADLASGVPAFGVEISPVSFAPASLPFTNLGGHELVNAVKSELDPDLAFTALSVPNPHLIAFMDTQTLEGPKLVALGRRLNGKNPYFPDGVNVTFATALKPAVLFARTYERGVGLTNACGTGMSATTLAYELKRPEFRNQEQMFTIYNPGGMVHTRVYTEQGTPWIQLSGNASFVAAVTLNQKDAFAGDFSQADCQDTGEEQQYQAFVAQLPYADLRRQTAHALN